MEIIKQQPDESTPNLWHIKIGGTATDGNYRLADTSRILTVGQTPQNWLDSNAVAAQALVDAGVINETFNQRRDFNDLDGQAQVEIDYLVGAIDTIDGMNAAQVRAAVKRLCRQNLRLIKAFRFVVKKLQ